MRYTCMCFGWYQELLAEVRVDDFAAAEAKLLEMLDRGGMIVHAYRETDPENPELVGRHRRLRSFIDAEASKKLPQSAALSHEIERLLVDPANLDAWSHASQTGGLLEQRWSVVELWPAAGPERQHIYGRALLIPPKAVDYSPPVPPVERLGRQL